MDLGSDDTPHVVYFDGTNHDLIYAVKGKRFWNRSIAIDPENAETYSVGARCYLESPTPDIEIGFDYLNRAIADYNKALELDPEYAHVHVNRALIQLQAGLLDEAMVDLSDAIRIDPSRAMAYYFRGSILKDKGDIEGARQDFETCLSITEDPMLETYARSALNECNL